MLIMGLGGRTNSTEERRGVGGDRDGGTGNCLPCKCYCCFVCTHVLKVDGAWEVRSNSFLPTTYFCLVDISNDGGCQESISILPWYFHVFFSALLSSHPKRNSWVSGHHVGWGHTNRLTSRALSCFDNDHFGFASLSDRGLISGSSQIIWSLRSSRRAYILVSTWQMKHFPDHNMS